MIYRSLLSFILLSFAIVLLSGQGAVNSPFSRFGIGDLAPDDFMHTRQMGGISTSYYDFSHLNFSNPASLSHLTSTGFDIGITGKYSKLKDDSASSNQWSGNLAYLGLGFPLRNPLNELFSREDYNFNWGMGFALLPHSAVSYQITTRDSLPEIGEFLRNFTGSGGLNKAIWGNSLKYKNVALGVDLGYLFGKIDYERNIDFTEERTAYDNQFIQSYGVRSFYWKLGFLYTYTFNKEQLEDNLGREEPVYVSVGITAKPNTGFRTESDIFFANLGPLSVQGRDIDTLESSFGKIGHGTLPAEFGFGVTYYHKNKLAIGVDLKRILWSRYKNDASPEQLEDTYRLSLGGYYRPNYKSIDGFLPRVYYRMGVYYEQDPRSINSERIDSYGLTLGFGLPFVWQRKISHMSIGMNVGQRSVTDVLRETFVKISFGFTFNDNEWFIQRKYN